MKILKVLLLNCVWLLIVVGLTFSSILFIPNFVTFFFNFIAIISIVIIGEYTYDFLKKVLKVQ